MRFQKKIWARCGRSHKERWKHERAHPHRHARMVKRLIRSLRKQLGLTQEQLARLMGVTKLTIKRWESTRHPSPRHWRRIRELWAMTKVIKTEEFWKDRVVPPSFAD